MRGELDLWTRSFMHPVIATGALNLHRTRMLNAIGRAVRSLWSSAIDFAFPPDNEDGSERKSLFEELLTFLHLK